MSFLLIYYEAITSSNTPSDIESSLATQLRTGMAKSRRSIGGCRGKVWFKVMYEIDGKMLEVKTILNQVGG